MLLGVVCINAFYIEPVEEDIDSQISDFKDILENPAS